MFIARVRTMDSKSVDPVLKNAVCKSIFTVEGKNTLNRISPGSRDVYEEPIVRYRNHLNLSRHSPDPGWLGVIFRFIGGGAQRNSIAATLVCSQIVGSLRLARLDPLLCIHRGAPFPSPFF